MQKVNIVKVYECENSISLDKKHLEDLAGGKFKVRSVLALLEDQEKEELEKASENQFNFRYYDQLLSDCMDEQATNYFIENCKSIYKETNFNVFSSQSEIVSYVKEEELEISL